MAKIKEQNEKIYKILYDYTITEINCMECRYFDSQRYCKECNLDKFKLRNEIEFDLKQIVKNIRNVIGNKKY